MQFYDEPLIHTPSTLQVIGPVGSGKSSFCAGLILHKNHVFSNPPKKIFYFYNVWSSTFELFSHLDYVTMCENLPSKNEIELFPENTMIFLDDLSLSAFDSPHIVDLVMVRCRHKKCSVVIISHNLFTKGKYSRQIHLNSAIYALFSNKQDLYQISLLGRRCFPNNQEFFFKFYQDAVSTKPFSYLLVDLHLLTNDLFRLRSQILPTDEVMIIYKL